MSRSSRFLLDCSAWNVGLRTFVPQQRRRIPLQRSHLRPLHRRRRSTGSESITPKEDMDSDPVLGVRPIHRPRGDTPARHCLVLTGTRRRVTEG